MQFGALHKSACGKISDMSQCPTGVRYALQCGRAPNLSTAATLTYGIVSSLGKRL
jgi:hypothetical protein